MIRLLCNNNRKSLLSEVRDTIHVTCSRTAKRIKENDDQTVAESPVPGIDKCHWQRRLRISSFPCVSARYFISPDYSASFVFPPIEHGRSSLRIREMLSICNTAPDCVFALNRGSMRKSPPVNRVPESFCRSLCESSMSSEGHKSSRTLYCFTRQNFISRFMSDMSSPSDMWGTLSTALSFFFYGDAVADV